MMFPQVNIPNMAAEQAGLYTQGYGLGTQQRRNRLMMAAGRQASRGQTQDARNTLLAGGEFGQADQFQRSLERMEDRDLKHASTVQQHLSNIASTIKTPEEFERAKTVLGQMGLPTDGYTFDMLPTLQAQAMTEGQRYARELTNRKMRLAEQRKQSGQVTKVGGNLVRVGPSGQVTELYRAPQVQKPAKLTDAERRAQAGGLKPGTPEYEKYVLQGPLNRQLTAADRKQIMQSDEAVQSGRNAITSLRQAMDLSKKAYSGASVFPETLGYMTSQLGYEGGEATEALSNIVKAQALEQLKATFGSMPTEGERKILLEIQGSVGQAPKVREAIWRRAIKMAQRRVRFNQQQAEALRSGQYYERGYTPAAREYTGIPVIDARQGRQQQSASPPVEGARQAPDGNWYVSDPSRPGKFLRVD
jgi:hypothetical protein